MCSHRVQLCALILRPIASHQALASARRIDHADLRDGSRARKPQIASVLTASLPYWT
jgi:hypothetical protein